MKLQTEIGGVTYVACVTDVNAMTCKYCVAGSLSSTRPRNKPLCDSLRAVNYTCGYNGEFVGDMAGKRIFWQTPEGFALWRLTK